MTARVRGWQIWSEGPSVVAWVLGTELVAAVCAMWGLASVHVTGDDIRRLAILAALALLYAETTSTIERLRRFLADAATVTMTSVWTLAAAIVLPVGLAAVLVLALYGHALLRRRGTGARPHRLIYTAATVSLACQAAGLTLHALVTAQPGWTAVGIVLAALALDLVNFGLVAVVNGFVHGPRAFSGMLRSGEENWLEAATLSLGALAGLVVLYQPWLSWLVLPLMLVLQRSAAVRQLQVRAMTDAKTGLLNASAWQQLATRQLLQAEREERAASLLLIDLDHFKRVNDECGHLAGDDALRAVADVLHRELREYDSVGRFGGEEFVALLPGVDAMAARTVAERLRLRIGELTLREGTGKHHYGIRLSTSIGMASYPRHGASIEELLRTADVALYWAKRTGRNKVGAVSGAEIA